VAQAIADWMRDNDKALHRSVTMLANV
jgi:hypothetical protein